MPRYYFNLTNGDSVADELTPEKRGELERLQKDFALRMQ
jgi:hypothetical protein